jgi:hypothetical protein
MTSIPRGIRSEPFVYVYSGSHRGAFRVIDTLPGGNLVVRRPFGATYYLAVLLKKGIVEGVGDRVQIREKVSLSRDGRSWILRSSVMDHEPSADCRCADCSVYFEGRAEDRADAEAKGA